MLDFTHSYICPEAWSLPSHSSLYVLVNVVPTNAAGYSALDKTLLPSPVSRQKALQIVPPAYFDWSSILASSLWE